MFLPPAPCWATGKFPGPYMGKFFGAIQGGFGVFPPRPGREGRKRALPYMMMALLAPGKKPGPKTRSPVFPPFIVPPRGMAGSMGPPTRGGKGEKTGPPGHPLFLGDFWGFFPGPGARAGFWAGGPCGPGTGAGGPFWAPNFFWGFWVPLVFVFGFNFGGKPFFRFLKALK